MTLLYFFFLFKFIKHRCEPSSNLRPPLPRAEKQLLRVRGRTLSLYADMPTMNIQISLKCHAVCAASKVLQNYNHLGLKEIGARPARLHDVGLFTHMRGCRS